MTSPARIAAVTATGVFVAIEAVGLNPVRDISGATLATCPKCNDASLVLATDPAQLRCTAGCSTPDVRAAFKDIAAGALPPHAAPLGAFVFTLDGRDRAALPPHAAEHAKVLWAKPLPPATLTGLAPLDALLKGGFRAESLYVLNAPTGRGKTGLAVQLSNFIATSRPVVYFSSELSARQVLARFAAQYLRLPWGHLLEMSPSDGPTTVSEALECLNLRVVELGRDTDIVGTLARVADADGRAPLCVLDYLQDAARRLNPDDRRLATAALSDDLKRWARDTSSVGLVVSSVGRAFYMDNDEKKASDLVGAAKESGDVDFDAAGIMFLDCADCPPGGTAPAKLHLSKSRFSAPGTVGLRFDGAIGMFSPDAAASFSEKDREVIDAVRAGADSKNAVFDVVGGNRGKLFERINQLTKRGALLNSPLRLGDQ